MSAKKPISLNKSHLSKGEIAEREAAEAAMTPATPLSLTPPPLLKKRPHARATWTRLIGLYFAAEGALINAFDEDLLTKYCILEDECLWLEGKRAEVDRNAMRLDKQLSKLKNPTGETLKIYYQLLEIYNALNTRVQGLDARLDGKRKLLLSYSQSLYLTPRSRAGVAPRAKPEDGPDEFGEQFDP